MTDDAGATRRSDIRADSSQQVWGRVSEQDGMVLVDGANGPRVFSAEH